MSDEPAEPEAEAKAEAEAPAKPRKKKRRSKPTIEMPAADREEGDDGEREPEDEADDEAPREADAPAGVSSKTKIIGAVALGLVVLGGIFLIQRASAPAGWSVGSEVDVELTLVAGDSKNLQCASKATVGALHCAYEDGTKEWAKDDKPVLMPYTTTDKKNLLGAGLWTDAGLANAKLPDSRFSVKCKFKVEGKLSKPQVRWNATGKWDDTQGDWAAGTLHNCSIAGATAGAGSAPPAPKPAGS